jgi:hypothetical protein
MRFNGGKSRKGRTESESRDDLTAVFGQFHMVSCRYRGKGTGGRREWNGGEVLPVRTMQKRGAF